MSNSQTHAGEKSLTGAFMRVLTRSNALCKEFKNNQTINKAPVYLIHILPPQQETIEDSYVGSKAPESLEDTVIYENNKKWRGYSREALQKQTQKELTTHFQKKFAAQPYKQTVLHLSRQKSYKSASRHLIQPLVPYALKGMTLEGMDSSSQDALNLKRICKRGNFSHKELNTLMNHPILQGDILC
ncbi:hypothetical protein [Bartonella jaculi]|uniref:Uncharacterized protein n=1 Tax=Bartonella jaculi TaxID=686226 RepID=A0ABP9N4P0_9HYPH